MSGLLETITWRGIDVQQITFRLSGNHRDRRLLRGRMLQGARCVLRWRPLFAQPSDSRVSKRVPVVMQSKERLLTVFCPCWSTPFCLMWSSILVDAAVPRVTQVRCSPQASLEVHISIAGTESRIITKAHVTEFMMSDGSCTLR